MCIKKLPTVLLSIVLVVVSQFSFAESRPNFVVILVDDQGYGDMGSYGSETIRTPRLDRMADEGIRFTNFYVGSSVCSASRASLLTGRYSARHGTKGVYFPGRGGMDPQELTIAEVLGENGYATACIGKWHLGDDLEFLPTKQGFDSYYGIPYSNDMFIGPRQTFAEDVELLEGYTIEMAKADRQYVADHLGQNQKIKKERGLADKVPLMEGELIVEYPAEQSSLTRRYFDRAIAFMEEQRDAKKPFFLYLTPAMPHIPLFASEDFVGKSKGGLYGDTIEEIDWNVGRLLDFLDANNLSEQTMVVYASDNGPWLGLGDASGSAGILRDGKFSNYEGGIRVPGIVRWKGRFSEGAVSEEVVSTIDILPTVVALADVDFPDVEIDGLDLTKHFENPAIRIEREVFVFLANGKATGVRVGDWKYTAEGFARHQKDRHGPELYNLAEDIREERNLYADKPEVAGRMQKVLERVRASFAQGRSL
ncbi:sulfatase family protein [Pelagicoccus mobilis]|uniref:Sulfatase n=1 Tax=Pelagicoccus mobilis TaxID=415221 RepID=A0A934RTZ2_9BACT|nr:sulfatase [Pelagicoccus mobilis]MBK1877570.1 sulfatase [Pelagicoccus mobilis]